MQVYIKTYGCRMNLVDSEVILRILSEHGIDYTDDIEMADIVILNCCSVREIGHQRAFEYVMTLEPKLDEDKVLIIAGCMATQFNEDIFTKHPRVQIFVHPTAYHELPSAIKAIRDKKVSHLYLKGTDSRCVYDDVIPLRNLEDNDAATITVMKGCDQYCSYCIEPFTRGERVNRDYDAIMREASDIRDRGYKEIILFGHIVDLWEGYADGEHKDFASLLADLAEACPGQLIKFISSHPLTFSDKIVKTIKEHDNICKLVHLPVQSGSNRILQLMNRRYTVEQYADRVRTIREIIPDMQIVTDIMVGFPGETDDDFTQTLTMIKELQFTSANVFSFSMRSGTKAAEMFVDDVSETTKEARIELVRKVVRSYN